MPYKDPEKQRASKRDAARRRRAREREQPMRAAVSADGALVPPPDRDEVLSLLGAQARAGHVTAMKTLLEEYRRADDATSQSADPLGSFDELAAKRSSRAG